MKRFYTGFMGFISVDHPTPALKQLPTAAAFAIGILILLTVPDVTITNDTLAVVGIALIVFATVLAAVMTGIERFDKLLIAIPLIDLLAIGAFRAGTGGATSLFGALIVLPVVWIAAEKGRRYILIAAVATSVALLMPTIFGQVAYSDVSGTLRGVYSPLVFALAAAIINELARQSRAQTEAIRRLADDREAMLEKTVESADQLRESEAKYREADRIFRGLWAAVTEQSVIGTDTTGLIDMWNVGAENILGPTADEMEGKGYVFQFHVSAELEELSRELNYPPGETVLNPGFSALVESARMGVAESREWTYIRQDGTEVPVMLSVTKRVDDEGATSGYLFVASDVTQAREVARLKDEFVGLISHELRTPLSSILGYLELLRDDEEQPLSEEQMQYLGVAERNAYRLLRLVGDLLFTAQVESGKFPLDAHDVELNRIVTASVESARPVANAAGVTMIERVPDVTPFVYGDALRLGQACDNLISNAIKFTPRGGTVTVAIDVTDTQVVISVRDTGLGIAASELDKLYSRFFRATTATRNAVPGVGLGLTITKAIVTAHRGQLDVESEEGEGTMFSVTLDRIAGVPAAVAQ